MKIKFLFFLNFIVLNLSGMNDLTYSVEQRIMDEIRKRRVDKVAEILNNGMSVDQIISSSLPRMPLLSFEARHNAIEVAELLILRGADVNLDYGMVQPLKIAIQKGNLAAAELLLKNEADPNVAIYDAVFVENIDAIKLLFKYRANVLYKYNDREAGYKYEGATIFDTAVYERAPEKIKVLLLSQKKKQERKLKKLLKNNYNNGE